MAKRGYKLQEFVAHSANVNCIKIGKKTGRHIITGGDDEKVNLWSIGKPTSIMSLSGHTSPIESVAFDSTEVLVAAGASSGVIKLWDLEETKVIRTLNGHRSYCTAVEFHPFGEFFASGSMDTNLKVWDIRRKGCIHTYKGHGRAISTIRFTPDGRWMVSGGLDNVVKIWDLTAGKLLQEFMFHEGHIRSIDFHPLEFLLATGSSDRTVKFWDLETFELIGSTQPEETGVRSITFHPDGRTLFCGLDSSLKVFSWEPVVSHDSVDMGWSTLGDLCIHDGKLLGCSYYQNSVGVWVADISHIEPYGHNVLAEKNTRMAPKTDFRESLTQRVGNPGSSIVPPDNETKDIKNIYVDSVTPVTSRKAKTSVKVVNLPNSKEIDTPTSKNFQRKPLVDDAAKDSSEDKIPTSTCVEEVLQKASSPRTLPRETRDGFVDSKPVQYVNGVAVVHGRTRSLVKKFENRDKLNTEECQIPDLPTQILSPHTDIMPATAVEQTLNVIPCEMPKMPPVPEAVPDIVPCAQPKAKTSEIPHVKSEEANFSPPLVTEKPKTSPEKVMASPMRRSATSRKVIPEKVRSTSVRVVRRFSASSQMIPERINTSCLLAVPRHDASTQIIPEKAKFSPLLDDNPQTTGRGLMSKNDDDVAEDLLLNHDMIISTLRSRLTKLQVVRHFWERNDTMGAINALQKLPDHAVQADVVGVMMEQTESLTLDLFSCLLPILSGLLDSNTERHVKLSLEMLSKLVKVFGHVVSSTISAPPSVGIDLHAEKRLECCKQCHVQLQKIHRSLPDVIRRGGLAGRCAQELNLILQQS